MPLLRFRSTRLDPEAEALIAETRARAGGRSTNRARLATFVVGGAFLPAAACCFVLLPGLRQISPLTLPLWIATYALVSRVEFEVGRGAVVPTQLVFVPMLLVLPLNVVPLAVAVALIVRRPLDLLRGRVGPESVFVLLLSSWHAVGPVLVLSPAGAGEPRWSDWSVYAAALAAQIAFDFGASSFREWFAFGTSPTSRWRFMSVVYGVDLALTPAGLAFAIMARSHPWSIVSVLPLVGLFGYFARERTARISNALELSHAYRGTAFLLGDVIEFDDAYTGQHSRDVVSLSVAVADRLGLSAPDRRDVELVALLHDVGKIRIPSEIINKPGPLTKEERAIIETHTIEGERMLESVGGLLGEAGRLVRSCHERWDGGGYPDGLVGEDAPIVARIVCCCDAFNAMTSNRSYRKAMSPDAAAAELRTEAGRQFDPQVVDALLAVVAQDLGRDAAVPATNAA